ncbi:MAG: His/Gly/Thr/Pro-type tRNA ligase C-terminal domain-containing protein, partial [Ignisphaera sp.]
SISRKRALLLLLVRDPSIITVVNTVIRDVRRKGIIVQVEMVSSTHRLSRWLEYASKGGFDYTLIVGKKELEKGTILVRDMGHWEQYEIPINKLAEFLVSRFG